MNYFDKNKLLTWAVVLLLLMNFGILGLLWFERPHKIPPPGNMQPGDLMPPDRGPKEFLIKELNLNNEQKKDYEKLVEEHRSEMRKIKEKIRKDKDEFWDIFSESGNDTAAAGKIASEIGADQKEIEMVTYRHFKKVRELCNEDQKKIFDEVIKEALRMMGPGNPPPPKH